MKSKLLIVLCAVGGLNAVTNAQVRVREDIEVVSHDPAKLSALKLAFQTLRESTDASSNLHHWANIHGATGGETSSGPCTHKEEAIWAWHRAYLWEFENALRASHPPETNNVTLAYWNWTAPASGQRYPSAYEDPASSLHWDNRITTPHPGAAVHSDSETVLLGIPDWRTFGGFTHAEAPHKSQMEVTVHDGVHGYVGVDMGSTQTSARDPIFWAHHANLDRIWLEWQALWHEDPAEPGVAMHGLPGTQGEWVDVSDKYTYGPPAAVSPVVAVSTPHVAADNLDSTHELIDSLQLAIPRERIRLVIKNIKYPKDVGRFVKANIYLLPVENSASSRDEKKLQSYSLGHFTDWLTPEHDHHEAAAAHREPSITLDVTDRASAIRAASGSKKLKLAFELTTQDANGKSRSISYGKDGLTFDASLEVVRVKNGKEESNKALKMKPLK